MNIISLTGFSKGEVQTMIKSLLSCMKQIRKQIIKNLGKEQFANIYSDMVLHLMKIGHLPNTATKIESAMEYCWIFERYDQLIGDRQYIQFYFTLAKWYEDLKDDKGARKCHEKILQREKLLGDCKEGCSNLELAKAFASTNDFERSIYYCAQELKKFDKIQASSFEEIMETADKLLQLYGIYSNVDSDLTFEELRGIANKLADLTDTMLPLSPLLIFRLNYTSNIIKMIHLFETIDSPIRAKKLRDHFESGLNFFSLSCDDISYLRYIVNDLVHTANDYKMAICIGQHIVNWLNNSPEWFVCGAPWRVSSILHNLGQAHYMLGNYTVSSNYYMKLAWGYMQLAGIVFIAIPFVYSYVPTAYNKFIVCLRTSFSTTCYPSLRRNIIPSSSVQYSHLDDVTDLTTLSTGTKVYDQTYTTPTKPGAPYFSVVSINFLTWFISISGIRYCLEVAVSFIVLALLLCWPCVLGRLTHCCHTHVYNFTCFIYKGTFILFLLMLNLPQNLTLLYNFLCIAVMVLALVAAIFTALLLNRAFINKFWSLFRAIMYLANLFCQI